MPPACELPTEVNACCSISLTSKALVDAAHAASHGVPETAAIVQRLRQVLEESDGEAVDLDEFLTEYDAVRGKL